MIEIFAKGSSVLFIAGFTYAMLATWIMRYMIDPVRVQGKEVKIFRSVEPPREVLTDRGVKMWWSKWIALGISLVFLALSIYFHGQMKKEPIQQPQQQRP